MSTQFLHNNLVKFCCARLNIFKLSVLKTLILKELNRYDLPIIVRPLKRAINRALIFCAHFIKSLRGIGIAKIILGTI